MVTYNPFEDFNPAFTKYRYLEPEVTKVEDPLFGLSNLPEGYRLSSTGNYIAPANTPESKAFDTSFIDKNAETHSDEYVPNNNLFDNKSLSNKVGYARDFFRKKLYKKLKESGKSDEEANNLSYIQSAGIIGNFMTESGDINLNTSAIGDSGKSIGLGQWNGSRRKNLESYAKDRGTSVSDLDTQLNFVWEEMTNKNYGQTPFKILEGILNTDTIEGATKVFMERFERPGVSHLSHRIKNAKSLK